MPSNASMHLSGSAEPPGEMWDDLQKQTTAKQEAQTHTNWTHNYAGHTSFWKQTKSCKKLQENSSIKKLTVNGHKGEMCGISVYVMKPCLVVLARFGQFWCQRVR